MTKPVVNSAQEHITQIAIRAPRGRSPIPVETAMARMEKNPKEFYIVAAHEAVDVVVYERESKKYIKTKPDATKKDNLLKFRQCNTGK